jgi:hypothetical protein
MDQEDQKRESLRFTAVIAKTTTDSLKIKIGAPGSSHEVAFEIWDVEIEDLLDLAEKELEVEIRPKN